MKPIGDPPKILIVEDHPATRKLLENILCQEYEVLTAENGEEALVQVKDNPDIDLILLDIIMPVMDGYETCEHLKTDETSAKIPIIFLTVMGEEGDEARGFQSGVIDYIIKPVSRLRLLARVKNQLAINHQQRLLEKKNQDLEDALQQINILQGILPICSFCKKIRDDTGDWQKIETYIQAHSSAEFSHSICPHCLTRHYPELAPPQK